MPVEITHDSDHPTSYPLARRRRLHRALIMLPASHRRPAIALCTALSGVVLALGGQFLLGQLRHDWGWFLYAIGLTGLVVGLAALPDKAATPCPDRSWSWAQGRLSLLTIVLAGQITSVVLARADHLLWPVALPWLISLVALLAWSRPAITLPWHRLAWLTARRLEMLAVIGLTLLAGLLRLPQLESIPSGVHGDEGEFGVLALATVQGQGPAPFGVAFLGDPALYVHLLAPFVALLGPDIQAIRLLSALVGTATVPVVYGLTRELFGLRPALLVALFLATSAVHIHFSRMALNVIEVPLLASLSLWSLARGIRYQRESWYLLAGITGGLCFYFHFGGRLIAPILLLVLLGQLVVAPRSWRSTFRATLLTGVGGLVVLMPMLAHLAGKFHQFTEHVDQRMVWNHWATTASRYQLLPSDVIGILTEQARRVMLAFTIRADTGDFYTFVGAPLLPGLLAPFALLGLVAVCVRRRKGDAILVLAWFAVPVILGNVLTAEVGQFHRLILALVPALLAAALLLDDLASLARQWLSTSLGTITMSLLFMVAPVVALWDGQVYFGPGVAAHPWPVHTAQAQYLQSLPPGTIAYIAGSPWIYADHGPSRYLGHAVERRDLRNPTDELPIETNGRPLAIIVNPALTTWLPLIRSYYPEVWPVKIEHPPGRTALTVLTIPPAMQPGPDKPDGGLRGEIRTTQPQATIQQRHDPAIVFHHLSKLAGAEAYTARWEGRLLVAEAGEYELELFSDGAVRLLLDSHPVLEREATPAGPREVRRKLHLQAGEHHLEIQGQWQRGDGYLSFLWQPPGGERQLVPPQALRPLEP